MRELASHGRIVVVSTHDDRVSQLADRVIELAPNFSDADGLPEEVRLGRVKSCSVRANAES